MDQPPVVKSQPWSAVFLAAVRPHVGQKRHVSRPLESNAQGALVSGACSGLTARLDLGALGQVAAQSGHILVIDMLHLVHAERAYLAAWHVALAIAPRAAGTAGPAAWS